MRHTAIALAFLALCLTPASRAQSPGVVGECCRLRMIHVTLIEASDVYEGTLIIIPMDHQHDPEYLPGALGARGATMTAGQYDRMWHGVPADIPEQVAPGDILPGGLPLFGPYALTPPTPKVKRPPVKQPTNWGRYPAPMPAGYYPHACGYCLPGIPLRLEDSWPCPGSPDCFGYGT